MSQRRSRVAVGLISTFAVLILLVGYACIMVMSLPLSLILSGGGMSTCLPGGTFVTTGNTGTDDTPQLPQKTIDRIEKFDVRGRTEQNMERYTYAEEKTGVPWAVIASLHYREAGMRGEGSILNGALIIGIPYINIDGQTVGANPNEDAVNAANALKRLADGVYGIDVTKANNSLEDWGKAFLAYNRGYLYKRAGVPYTLSPYVMNGLDDQHMDMRWSSADTVKGVDGNKIGALAVLTYLDRQNLGMRGCGSSTVVSPVKSDDVYITSGAGQRGRYSSSQGQYINRLHYGLDLVGGADIVAVSSGTVTIAQNGYYGYGTTVKIDHGNGTQSLYGHMVSDSLKVKVGDTVSAGQLLGTMGNTGNSDGVHLHFEVWQNDTRINPYAFLTENGVKLTWRKGASPHNEKPGPL